MNVLTRISLLVAFAALISLSLCFSQSHLQKGTQTDQKTSVGQALSVTSVGSLNINNLWLKVRGDGKLGFDSANGRGLTYPLWSGSLLYADNICWVGKVYDGQLPDVFRQLPELRTGGGAYRVGVRPGAIVSKGIAEDPNSESVRVYHFRPDYQSADLSFDAAALNGVQITEVTPAMVSALRESYKKDVSDWPWQKGAPFIDKNDNGRMDSGELPGLENASQLLWFVYNDLDVTVCKSFAADPPIGLEVQVTLWAYKGAPNLEDVIFKRYRLIYKGTASAAAGSTIDSMFVMQWVDSDIGKATNDLGGCDSLLDLAYGYNASSNGNDQDEMYKILNMTTPGLGYTILQGPLVRGSNGEVGVFDFQTRAGFRNLPMTSCAIHMTGLGDGLSEPQGVWSYYFWNVARGYRASQYPITSYPWLDHANKPSKFMYYGDPVSRTGWFAAWPSSGYYQNANFDYPGGDLRFYLNSGPFTMALGDTQEVVVAMIASAAPASVQNATWLKNRAKYVRAIYPKLGDYVSGFTTGISGESFEPNEMSLAQNYPNPFNPSTRIRFTIPREGQVRLSVFDLLGREIRVLHKGSLSAGEHALSWDGRNATGDPAPSGVYFYRLVQGDRQSTRKLLLVR